MAQNAVERKTPGNQEGLRLTQVWLQKEMDGGKNSVLSNPCITRPGHRRPENQMKLCNQDFWSANLGDGLWIAELDMPPGKAMGTGFG